MDFSEGYAGVTVDWLYQTIEKNERDALINNHKSYVAAKKIADALKYWCDKEKYAKKIDHVITIQRYVRGWLTRIRYFEYLKKIYYQRLMCYYNMMATRIQALWHGFYSRKHIHDHLKLRRGQEEAAKQLIICIAHKLHYMLRTKVSPGVFSILNSHCLSKVERLLASLKFTSYNKEIRKLNEAQMNIIHECMEVTKNNRGYVKVPYYDGLEVCSHLGGNKMTEMLSKYHQQSKKEDEMINKKTCEVIKKKKICHVEEEPKGFCAHVVKSLTSWGIVKDDKRFIVCPSIVQKPDKILAFLSDVEDVMSKRGL